MAEKLRPELSLSERMVGKGKVVGRGWEALKKTMSDSFWHHAARQWSVVLATG